MNILQITKYFYPSISFGGPVQCSYNLSKFLVKQGHDVTVYATDALDINTNVKIKEKYQQIDGINVYYFPNIARFYGWFVSPDLIQAIRKNIENFDVVHLHEYRTFQNLAFYYFNKRRVPYVLSCHGEFSYEKESWDWFALRRFFERFFGRNLVNNANRLHALTKFEAAQYLDAGIDDDKVVVIPNGVSVEDFSDTLRGSFRKSYRINNNEKIILYLGRIHNGKGIDILVKAFALLSKEQNDLKLVIAGPDDCFLACLEKLVEDLNLIDKVIFTGSLDRNHVLAAYSDASVVVYASIQEGFPLVPLEAGIMGKPVIVSTAPAMDYVRKGNFGLSVEYGNVIQLKNSLKKILTNPKFSEELGRNGKNFVRQKYSWETIGKKIESMYLSISQK